MIKQITVAECDICGRTEKARPETFRNETDYKLPEGWMQCRRPGEPFDTHRRTLTVHHINHTPEDCRRENLVALCSGCHLRADAKFHAEHRKKTKENKP